MSGSFHSNFVAGGMRANAFLPFGCGDPEDRKRAVGKAAARRVSTEILAVLREQNGTLSPSAARQANLEAMAQPGTVVVATGQQVGLFLGPLYTAYKAATAIAVARALSAQTGARCVPLFWLQTEDHDFAEIATTWAPGPDAELLKLSLAEAPEEPSLDRRCVGCRRLGNEVTPLLEELGRALDRLPHAPEVVSLLREHYRPGAELWSAFARVLASLFADDGLVLFNPRHSAVARMSIPVFRAAMLEAPQIERALVEREHALAAAGFAEQVPVRRGFSLACYHTEDTNGPRQRIPYDGAGYLLPGGSAPSTKAEVVALLQKEPLRFSTTALLRPILQDSLFPTAAYVGGPAEVDYFAQAAVLYPLFGLTAPLVVPRSHFRLIPRRLAVRLDQLGLTAADFDQPGDELLRRLAKRLPASGDGAVPDVGWAVEMERRLEGVVAGAPRLDPGLVRAAERTRATVRRALERLGRRYRRAILEREEVLAGRLARAGAWLRPDGKPQERVFGFPAFAAMVGLSTFRKGIAEALTPFDPSIRDVLLA